MKRYLPFLFLLFFSCNNHETTSAKRDRQQLNPIIASDRILAFVYSENGKSGLTDSSNNIILPAQFDYIENWQIDNLIRIDSGGNIINGGDFVGYNFKKYGLINIQGQILFRPQFDELKVANNAALVRIDSLYGYVDDKGNWLMKPKFKMAYPFYKETAIVTDSGQYFLLNKQGQRIMAQSFDSVWSFKNDIALVVKNKKWGFVNYRGKYILPLGNFKGIGEYNWYFGVFKKEDKWFVIDTAGHLPIKDGFDEVQISGNEDSVFAVGKQNEKTVNIRLK